MKKTKRTILTAAILTAASASSTFQANAKGLNRGMETMTCVYGPPPSYFENQNGEPDGMYDVYGPPSYFIDTQGKLGDVNEDGVKNIADYCQMLGLANIDKDEVDPSLSDEVKNLLADINEDGFVDKYDFLSMRRYLFGLDDDLIAYYFGDHEAAEIDEDTFEETQCTDCSWIPDETTVKSIITTYGVRGYFESMRYSESVSISESISISESESRAREEELATAEVSSDSVMTSLSEPIFQTKYGIVPIYNKESLTTEVPDDVIK